MTQREKLIERLLSKPKDFTWNELIKVLGAFDYELINGGKTGGSRARFIYPEYSPILLHKPHPAPILKRYQLVGIIEQLTLEGLL